MCNDDFLNGDEKAVKTNLNTNLERQADCILQTLYLTQIYHEWNESVPIHVDIIVE